MARYAKVTFPIVHKKTSVWKMIFFLNIVEIAELVLDLALGVNLIASLGVTKVKMEMTVITLENVIVHFSVTI